MSYLCKLKTPPKGGVINDKENSDLVLKIPNSANLFLTLTHYSIDSPPSPWFIPNGGNTGIGNMLFQISSCIAFSIKNNATLFVPGLETFFKVEKLEKKNTIFRNINSECPDEYLKVKENIIVSHPQKCIWDYEFSNNMNFHPYFENYRNFQDYRNIILKTFRPSTTDFNYIINKYPIILEDNICSIHVRLGPDYKEIYNENNNRLKELENTYFKCIDHMILEKNIHIFFVFTNDKKYCINILNNNPKYNNIRFIYSEERDYIDVWMISLIKNNITSVSTLAWWGSFLNENTDKYILCCKGCRDDLHYPEWVII